MERVPSAARVRRFGAWMCLWPLATAALPGCWQASFLVGLLVLGVGTGLWDWGGRRWS